MLLIKNFLHDGTIFCGSCNVNCTQTLSEPHTVHEACIETGLQMHCDITQHPYVRCYLQHSLTTSVHWHGVLFVSFVCLRNITSSVEYAVTNQGLVCLTVIHILVLGIMFNSISYLKAEAELGTGEKWMNDGVAHAPFLHSPPTQRCIV